MNFIYKEADSIKTPESTNVKVMQHSPSAVRVLSLQKKSEFEIRNHYKKKLLLIDRPVLNSPSQKYHKELISPTKKSKQP